MDTLITTPTSCRMQNMQFVQNDCQFQLMFVATCLIVLITHLNIIFIVKVNSLNDIEMVIYKFPQLCCL
jgi:hypothetical protein